jgi:hypothetical protein
MTYELIKDQFCVIAIYTSDFGKTTAEVLVDSERLVLDK